MNYGILNRIENFTDISKCAVEYVLDTGECSVVCPSCGAVHLNERCDCYSPEFFRELQTILDDLVGQ